MKLSPLFLSALVCCALCSCRNSQTERNDTDANAKSITTDEARQIGMHILLNRYPKAEIVSEQGDGQSWTYRFSTNGVVAPVAVVVERKTARGRFEKLTH